MAETDLCHLMVHNLTGWPAVVVRCGTWQDATALAVAAHLEKVFGGWQPSDSAA